MNKIAVAVVCSVLGLTSYAGKKASVFVDDFLVNEGCQITKADLQNLYDRVIGNVVSSRKYEVVERKNIAKVQKELQLVDAGLVDGSAPQSNKLQAAGYCIYGKILQCRNSKTQTVVGELNVESVKGIVELQLRITNIQTGRLLGAKTIKKTIIKHLSSALNTSRNLEQEVMAEAFAAAAKDVVMVLNDVAFPVYVLSANSRFVTGNITSEQVVLGDVWEVFELGDELKDPQTGEILGFDEELIAKVRVSRPGPKTTKFEYIGEKDKKFVLQAKEDNIKMILRLAPEKNEEKKASVHRGVREALGVL